MSKVIHKFKLSVSREPQLIVIPRNPSILKVDEQDGMLMMWALIDDDNEIGEIEIELAFTGDELRELPQNKLRQHLNSVVMSHGIVWHVFRLLEISQNT